VRIESVTIRWGDYVFAWIIYDRNKAASDGAMSSKALEQCEVDDSLEIKLNDECAKVWLPIYEKTTVADILNALCIGKGI
jgi:hypothetical protein